MAHEPAFTHVPVMATEVVELFAPVPDGVLVDCTVGGGGHASLLLADVDGRRLLGLDQDEHALAAASRSLEPYGARVTLRRARFDSLAEVIADTAAAPIVGVLFDLGVSSPQFDQPERGFSYRHTAPLDMRMDQRTPRTAADVVNGYDEARLIEVLQTYGDERFARRIARAVVAARPLATTTELADVVRDAIPAAARRRGGHPAKRTFQAIRIEVNDELTVLRDALDQAIDALVPGGRCVVLSYHSGEDRLVKQCFRDAETGGCTCPPDLPCVCGAQPRVRLVTRGALQAQPVEVAANRRAASVRLRAAEKLEVGQ